MSSSVVTRVLARLRAAADQARGGFPATRWTRVQGPGPDTIDLNGHGGFIGLALEPGVPLTLRCVLHLPEESLGVPFVGEPLEATISSLYPVEINWNGATVLKLEGVPVAAGPALTTLIPALQPGDNGVLEWTIFPPNHQLTTWTGLHFHTPGLRARFEMLDIAWARIALAEALAVSGEEMELVEKAASLVPPELAPAGTNELGEALDQIISALVPFEERILAITVHLVGHSHIDMNWLWTWPDTVEVIRRDLKSVLSLMDDYPELTFSHSQPATYEVFRQEEPALFAKLLERIREGRWEPLTMCWVEGDVNMASGEAMCRQLLEGVRYTEDVLEAKASTLHAPDTFGHAGNLPQLAVSAGAVRYYHHRANAGQEDQWPAYWWEGQDGTRILGISTLAYNGDITAGDLARAAIRAHRHGHPTAAYFHGMGDHGGGPARQNLDALRRFQQTPGLPSARCSTLARYSDELLASGAELPVWKGESSTIFEGCYTTHADTKLYNRQGENLLCTADTVAALAGLNATADLQPAWRKVLFNQFHDILDGSAIHEAYEKNRQDFEEVEAAADSVVRQALSVLHHGIPEGEIAVTNPLGFDRSDWVVVTDIQSSGPVWLVGSNGHVTPGQPTPDGIGFVARIPAFSTVSYTMQTEPPAGAADPGVLEPVPAYAPTDDRRLSLLAEVSDAAPYLKVETPDFIAYVRRDSGIIVSLLDRRVGRQLVGFGLRRGSDYIDAARADLALGVLQLLEEHPHGMTAWQFSEVHAEHSLLNGATTEVVESGPARCIVQATHKLRSSTIVQQVIFYRDLARIDFRTKVDWQEIGNAEVGIPNLKVSFTARLPETNAWFETPYAAVKRPADGQESPALRWVDVGGDEYGIALLNDSKYGHDILGSRARITLMRSAYDPDAISDPGQHDIRYSLVPHPGNWRDAGIVRTAAAFNQPLLARRVGPSAAAESPAFRIKPILEGNTSVQIGCLKMSHDGTGTIIRLYESAGASPLVRISGLPPEAEIWETDVVEDGRGAILTDDDSITLAFKPWQVRTLLVEPPIIEAEGCRL